MSSDQWTATQQGSVRTEFARANGSRQAFGRVSRNDEFARTVSPARPERFRTLLISAMQFTAALVVGETLMSGLERSSTSSRCRPISFFRVVLMLARQRRVMSSMASPLWDALESANLAPICSWSIFGRTSTPASSVCTVCYDAAA
jgi:hypothetical protein